jgi:hypothetical protein
MRHDMDWELGRSRLKGKAMWALLLSSVMWPAPVSDLRLDTVNGQPVILRVSPVVLLDHSAERRDAGAFLDAMRRRFGKQKAGASQE